MRPRAVFQAAAIAAAAAVSLVYLSDALAGPAGGAGKGCITPKCHARMLEPKFVHGPVAVQDCVLCHRRTGEHSFKLAAQGQELCYLCHERMNPRHGTACITCHDPHGSEREFQLKPGVKGKN